jgi:hypothetical protein
VVDDEDVAANVPLAQDTDPLRNEEDLLAASSASSPPQSELDPDRIVYEVTAIKYTLPGNSNSNIDNHTANEPSTFNNNNTISQEDEFVFKYTNKRVNASLSTTTSLLSAASTSTSVKRLIGVSSKRFYRRIGHHLHKTVFLNASTGDLFLLEQPDRERTLSMRFRVYVRDAGGLNNSVPVHVEVVDINDSRPQCVSQRGGSLLSNVNKRNNNNNNEEDSESSDKASQAASSKPLDIYALQVNSKLSLEHQSAQQQQQTTRLVKLYKFR